MKIIDRIMRKEVGESDKTPLHNANAGSIQNNPQLHTAKLQPLLPNLPLFRSRVYLSHRSYLVRIPTNIARKQGFEGGEIVIFAIARKVSDY